MILNILVGGKAGQGINLVSGILTQILTQQGYYTFNYRDYQSLIRGGHNFNVLSISDKPLHSNESMIDIIVALDDRTIEEHKKELKKGGTLITYTDYRDLGRNLNFALAGALLKILGIPLNILQEQITKKFGNKKEMIEATIKGHQSEEQKFELTKRKKINVQSLSGSQAIALGAQNSKLDTYIAYPMTPSTNALHEMAHKQLEKGMLVFQAENEISVANMALGASFAGAKTMIGTSGGGFDLMGETLSLQGISEIPLTVYLASRPGPGTGVPTYTAQADLDIALRNGHGEFPRVVIAPGTSEEAVKATSEALYLAETRKTLSIILSDKHIAESEYTVEQQRWKTPIYNLKRKLPGTNRVRASSYEANDNGDSTEDAQIVKKNVEARMKKYDGIKKEIKKKKFEMIKIWGDKKAETLIIGWGSPSGAIRDALERGIKAKYLQIIYMKPLSDEIRKEMQKAKRTILIENNVTGQLGRLLREKTGIKPDKKILKYDGRPFNVDELEQEIRRAMK